MKATLLAGVLSLVVTAVVYLQLAAAGLFLPLMPLWFLIAGLLLARRLWRPVREPPPPPGPRSPPPELARPSNPVADRWERRLQRTADDPERFGRAVQERIAELVAERLRQRRGVGTLDPALLGDELRAFLTAPPTRTLSPAELDRVIAGIEEI